ncbi:hypothetical protein HXX76_004272 [Chlamydomonas incerta]|uniref:Uncharacterized protein n=1 Tax=Chlamydomonas incerta TaxID=51695 RepID=A0A835W7L3_CHLIN|nr:hypothetical protein HXX76_004272 [Chlamydomonas incerta]|eukprot:KAG2440159.1 hypothetical protein HXX76_004272 [Chlamydomonas incerta]
MAQVLLGPRLQQASRLAAEGAGAAAAVQFTAARCTDILAWAVEAASHPHPDAAAGHSTATESHLFGEPTGLMMGHAGVLSTAAAAAPSAAGFDWSWSAAPPLTSPTRLSMLYDHCLGSELGNALALLLSEQQRHQHQHSFGLGRGVAGETPAGFAVPPADAVLASTGNAAVHQPAAAAVPLPYSHARGVRQVFGTSSLPVTRTFSGFPADLEIIGLLALALTQQQNNVGRDTSANSGLVTTFRGVTFPFGVSFATTNSFGGAVQQAFDFATATDQRGAAADGLETGRAIGSVPFGDVNVVNNVLSSALSQRRLVRPRNPPQPPHQQQQQQDSQGSRKGPLKATGDGAGGFRDGAQQQPGDEQAANQSPQQSLQQQPGSWQSRRNSSAAMGAATAKETAAEADEGDSAAARAASYRRAAELLDEYAYWNGYMGTFYNLEYDMAAAEVAARDHPPSAPKSDNVDEQHTAGETEGAAASGGKQGGTRSAGAETKAAAAAARRRNWQQRAQAAVAAAEAGDEEYAAALMGWSLAPPTGRIPRPPPLPQQESAGPHADGDSRGGGSGCAQLNAFDVQLRTGAGSPLQGGQTSSKDGSGNGTSSGRAGGVNQYLYDPFDVLLASTLEYGRAGQYSYFYSDYYRFLSTYYSGPVIAPQTALGRTRSTSAVVRDNTATTAGSSQNAATGLNVATVVQSVSAAIRGISQSLKQSDILGNSTFTGAPQQPTRQAGVVAGGLTFGRGYYFQAPSESFTKAATTSSIGGGGATTAGAGEENLDFDIAG